MPLGLFRQIFIARIFGKKLEVAYCNLLAFLYPIAEEIPTTLFFFIICTTSKGKPQRPYKVYIFLISMTLGVDLVMPVRLYGCVMFIVGTLLATKMKI